MLVQARHMDALSPGELGEAGRFSELSGHDQIYILSNDINAKKN